MTPKAQKPLEVVESPQRNRFLIGSTSDKGGNGKSTFARVMAHIATQRAIPMLAFDCDRRNAQLYRYYNETFASILDSDEGVARIDLNVKGGADKLINSLELEAPQIVLIDFPAGGGELFEKLEKDIDLFALLKEVGYKLTMVSVLSRVKDSINSLSSLMECCKGRANQIAVKNGFFGDPDKFSRFDNSKTKKALLSEGGIIINFPDLYDDTYDRLDDKNMTFSHALTPESGLHLADRRRVKVFLDQAEAELLKADKFLGLG